MTRTLHLARRRDQLVGSAAIVPALVLFAVFVFYPLVKTVVLSLSGTDLFGRSTGLVGFDNFSALAGDPAFGQTMRVTALFTLGVVVLRLVCGIAIAAPLATKLRGQPVFRALLTSPMAASVATGSVAFAAMLNPGVSIVNAIVVALGGSPVEWLTSTTWALPSVIVATVWGELGFTVLLLTTAFANVDEQVLEAARIDGASSWRIFRSITLPLVTPTLFFLLVTGTVAALRTFGQIQILTKGGPSSSTTTLVYNIYTAAFGSGGADLAAASAMGLVLFVIVLAISGLQFGVLEKRVNY
ncbi:sugar ABC transporter permease [Kribbella sp. NPDC051770]|uniref:carbohydrate ABC transporter permease n=1 Tax=Kribbella sp. NPDC051770 TaxID=3155413 RepID=UPI003418132C